MTKTENITKLIQEANTTSPSENPITIDIFGNVKCGLTKKEMKPLCWQASLELCENCDYNKNKSRGKK